MEILFGYWWLLLIGIAIISILGYYLYNFKNKPTSQQIAEIKEWLLYAVAQAEKELGAGTGQIKLRYVYDKFLITFPSIAPFLPFALFSALVDEVLEQFRQILKNNKQVKSYVEGKQE